MKQLTVIERAVCECDMQGSLKSAVVQPRHVCSNHTFHSETGGEEAQEGTHTHTHTHTHTCTQIHVHTHTHAHTHKYTYTHLHTHTHTDSHTHTYTHTHIYREREREKGTHTYKYTLTHTHTHTHTLHRLCFHKENGRDCRRGKSDGERMHVLVINTDPQPRITSI